MMTHIFTDRHVLSSDHFSLLAELGLCPDGFPENEPSSRPPAVSTAVTSTFMGGGLGNFGGSGGGHASGRMFHSHGFGGFGGPHNGGGGGVIGQGRCNHLACVLKHVQSC